jgi:hypothetical protein
VVDDRALFRARSTIILPGAVVPSHSEILVHSQAGWFYKT